MHLGAVCDEFYVTVRLFLKLEMKLERETVLHFFDRLRRDFPDLCRFRRREDGCLLLEGEDADIGRRWVRLDRDSLRFGHVEPVSLDQVRRFADLILQQAPFHMTFSELDYDHVDLQYGFDLNYQGNHDKLLAETFYADHPLAELLFSPRVAQVIDAQPYVGVALNVECDRQLYVEVRSRTNSFEVRSGRYERQVISLFLTARQYWGLGALPALHEVQKALFDVADEWATECVVPKMVNPLAAAIASQPEEE